MASRRQLAEGHGRVVAYVVPRRRSVVRLVGILQQTVVRIVEGSKADGQVALVGLHGQHAAAEQRVSRPLALIAHAGKHDGRAETACTDVGSTERQHAAQRPHPQAATAVGSGQRVGRLHSVGHAVTAKLHQLLPAWLVALDATLADNPHVALLVLGHGQRVDGRRVQRLNRQQGQFVVQQRAVGYPLYAAAYRGHVDGAVPADQRLHHVAAVERPAVVGAMACGVERHAGRLQAGVTRHQSRRGRDQRVAMAVEGQPAYLQKLLLRIARQLVAAMQEAQRAASLPHGDVQSASEGA